MRNLPPSNSKIDRDKSKYRHENDEGEEWGCIDCADEHVRSLAFANLESVANLEQNDRGCWIRDCFWVDDCHRHEKDWARWHRFKDTIESESDQGLRG